MAKQFITPSPRCPDPHRLIFNGYRGSFPGQKRLGHEVDSSSPSSAEVKNEWSYTSTPHIRLHGMDRKDLSFLLLYNFSLVVAVNLK
jgi:hypothetical protein